MWLWSTTEKSWTFKLLSVCVLFLLLNARGSGQQTAILITEDDIRQIVDAHNLFRGMVEPPASNMQRTVSQFQVHQLQLYYNNILYD